MTTTPEATVNVLFCSGFAALIEDPAASVHFYRDVLGLPLGDGEYVSTPDVEGLKHFGLWPLSDAARSCFGAEAWPADVPRPQGCLEFEVDDVAAAAKELEGRGCRLLVGPATEPWGQQVARLLSPEGLLIGVTYTPWLREAGTIDE